MLEVDVGGSVPARAFISARAQYSNLGDLVLRRETVLLARQLGFSPVVNAVGTPPDWLDAMGLCSGDVVYARRGRWLLSLLRSCLTTRTVLVYAPGDFALTLRDVPREIVQVGLTLVVVGLGGSVIRLQRSLRVYSKLCLQLHRAACRWSTYVSWRDLRTARSVGIGEVVPDLSLASVGCGAAPSCGVRDLVAMSFRGDRKEHVSQSLLDVIASTGDELNLKVVSLAQVSGDNSMVESLGGRLGSPYRLWDPRDLEEGEREVEEIYNRTSIIFSNRLHVLLLAAIHGAVPICIRAHENPKVVGAMALIGLENCSIDIHDTSVEKVREIVATYSPHVLVRAAAQVQQQRETIRLALTRPRCTRKREGAS